MLSRLKVRQFPELDSIRLLSILIVILHHQLSEQNAVLQWFTKNGWVGVDIFFVMSGFLITQNMLKEYQTTGTLSLRNFWFKRMLRLWPSWLLVLTVSSAVVLFLARNQPLVEAELRSKISHYYLHFANYSFLYYGKIHGLFNHFWSLAVEEHFYLGWPLLLLAVVRFPKLLTPFIIGLMLIPYGFRIYHDEQNDPLIFLKFATHTRFDQLICGCLLAVHFPRIRPLSFLTEVVLTVLMVFLFIAGIHFLHDSSLPAPLAQLDYTLVGLASALLIIVSLKGSERGLRRIFRNETISKLGILSYGVYLVHLLCQTLVFVVFHRIHPTVDQNLLAVMNLVLPFIPAYFMYFYIDEYFARFRHALKS